MNTPIKDTRAATSGSSAPLGATVRRLGGVNFSVFSKHAARMELLLFDDDNAAQPATVIPLDAEQHRTYHYWHAFVPDIRPGQVYGYRAHGPFAPDHGLRFDAEKVLLDPYGFAISVPEAYDRGAAARPGSALGPLELEHQLAQEPVQPVLLSLGERARQCPTTNQLFDPGIAFGRPARERAETSTVYKPAAGFVVGLVQ